jgi:pimeloyl-ACP methyl ester carboxylesterase
VKVIVKGIATEYRDEGAGPTILMLHGWGDSLHAFDALTPYLDGFRILRLDLPGFGDTELPRGEWNVGDYARFVSEFCQKLSIVPTYVLGHSFGGRILVKAVGSNILHPKKLMLIASAGVADRPTIRNHFFMGIAKVGRVLLSPVPWRWYVRLRKELYRVTGGDYVSTGALKETFIRVISEDLSADASRVAIPTLLVWGTDDLVTPVSEGRKFHRMISGAHLEVLKNAGHFVHREKPAEVSALITQFLI